MADQFLYPSLVVDEDSFGIPETLTPTYYFALTETPETFSVAHQREDLYVFEFKRVLAEGDFPTFEIVVENPLTGPLNLPQWLWASWHDGSNVVPLFIGRLVNIPSNIQDTVITLTYRCEPPDYEDQRIAVMNSKKVLPMWDEVFTDPTHVDNPDAVLEGYSEVWHTGATDMVVSTSDIIVGEAGTISFFFDDGEVFYDGLDQRCDGKPQTAITIEMNVGWTQQHTGTVNFGQFLVKSMNPGALAGSFPSQGSNLQGGWSVASVDIANYSLWEPQPFSFSFSWQNQAKKHRDGDTMSISESYNGFVNMGLGQHVLTESYTIIIGDPHTGRGAETHRSRTAYNVTLGTVSTATISFSLNYEAKRQRKETLRFTLRADIQPVIRSITDPPSAQTVSVPGRDVGVPLSDSSIPIGDTLRRSYFPTDRGNLSYQHGICRARAALLSGTRVGRVGWGGEFLKMSTVTCRHNAYIEDPRLAGGGKAIGKVINAELSGNGDTGEFMGTVTIGCSVGNGNAIVEMAGTPTYVDDGYMDNVQIRTGQTIFALPAADVGYSIPIDEPTDDGVQFPITDKSQVLVRVEDHIEEPEKPLTPPVKPPEAIDLTKSYVETYNQKMMEAAQANVDASNNKQAWTDIEIKTLVGGPYEQVFEGVVTDLMVTKQMDLSGIP